MGAPLAEYSPATDLRIRLEELRRRRGALCEELRELEREIGEHLAEVRITPGLSFAEACRLVDYSKPKCYRLLEEAGPA